MFFALNKVMNVHASSKSTAGIDKSLLCIQEDFDADDSFDQMDFDFEQIVSNQQQSAAQQPCPQPGQQSRRLASIPRAALQEVQRQPQPHRLQAAPLSTLMPCAVPVVQSTDPSAAPDPPAAHTAPPVQAPPRASLPDINEQLAQLAAELLDGPQLPPPDRAAALHEERRRLTAVKNALMQQSSAPATSQTGTNLTPGSAATHHPASPFMPQAPQDHACAQRTAMPVPGSKPRTSTCLWQPDRGSMHRMEQASSAAPLASDPRLRQAAGSEAVDCRQTDGTRGGAWERAFPWSQDVENANRQFFGNGAFRLHQRQAINASMAGRDCFVLMPTGGGGSACGLFSQTGIMHAAWQALHGLGDAARPALLHRPACAAHHVACKSDIHEPPPDFLSGNLRHFVAWLQARACAINCRPCSRPG